MFKLRDIATVNIATQGISTDGVYFYKNSDNIPRKFDLSWNLLLTHWTAPVETGTNHLGGAGVYDGKLYIACLNRPGIADQRISVFNNSDLSFVANHDISAEGADVSSLAIDAANDTIWVSSFSDGSKLWQYKLSDFSYIGTVNLNNTLSGIQGIACNGDYLYIHEDSKHRIYQFTKTGSVVATVAQTEHESEDIDYTGANLLATSMSVVDSSTRIYTFEDVGVVVSETVGGSGPAEQQQEERYIRSLLPALYLPLWNAPENKPFLSKDGAGIKATHQTLNPTRAKNGLYYPDTCNTALTNAPPTVLTGANNVALIVWFQTALTPATIAGTFARIIDPSDDNCGLYYSKSSGGLVWKIGTTEGTNPRPMIPTASLQTNRWMCVAAFYNGTKASLLLNGNVINTVTRDGTGLSSTCQNWQIAHGTSTYGLTMTLGAVIMLRNTSLTMLREIYRLTKWRYR